MTMFLRPLPGFAAIFAAGLLLVPQQSRAQDASGWTSLVWRVAQSPQVPVESTILFTSDAGVTSELRISDQALQSVGGAMAIDRKRVMLGGVAMSSVSGNSAASPRVIQAASIHVMSGPMSTMSDAGAAPQSGSKSYVTVLCRFADSLDVAPRSPTYYKGLMTGADRPGLNHYWKEVSDNRIDIAGSLVAGWYNLPGKKADYFPSGDPSRPDWQKMLTECSGVADADVDFSKFFGINLQFDLRMDYSWGGSAFISRDGISRIIPTTWMAPWATQHTYAHEMGHSLGLPHSSGPYQATYDSRWDPMSGGMAHEADDNVAVHTISYHKDVLGWIPPSQKYVAPPGLRQTITLQRLAVPGASTDYLMAQIPIGTLGTTFYTVEARNQNGYDSGLPAAAIIIHRVDPRLPDRAAQVVDADGNGNPNDAGAMWLPGETFADIGADLSVTVVSATATTFRVTIQRGAEPVAISSSAVRNGTIGVDYADTVKATGGLGAFSFTLTGGALPQGVVLEQSTGALIGIPRKAGSYAFTITATSGARSDVKQFAMSVVKPSLQAQQVLDQLLGTGTMTSDEIRFLDIIGNNNGRIDIGDVRAWLVDQGQISADMQKQFEQIVGPLKPQVKEKK